MSALAIAKKQGFKIQYLIKRRDSTSREELIAHWYANHMPGVISRNHKNRMEQKPFADRYLVTLFDTTLSPPGKWDGVAQLWYDEAPPRQTQASGIVPQDSFHEKVEPYWPWTTEEWVALAGELPLSPLTLNAPFPCTRSGFVKQTSLVAAKPNVEVADLFDHWLTVHLPNVRDTLVEVGGLRYAVSLSVDANAAPYAGMAELYFPNRAAQAGFWQLLKPDGFQKLVDPGKTVRFLSGTELVGIE